MRTEIKQTASDLENRNSDITEILKNQKWTWAGRVARRIDNRWSRRLTDYSPGGIRWSRRRSDGRYGEIEKIAGRDRHSVSSNGGCWGKILFWRGFVTVNGDDSVYKYNIVYVYVYYIVLKYCG